MKKHFIIAVTAMVMYGAFQLISAKQSSTQVNVSAPVCAENSTHTISNVPTGSNTQLPVIIHIDM
ncbi:MAG: hypothetical protein V4685_05100 [Bacteroidota bacterium]